MCVYVYVYYYYVFIYIFILSHFFKSILCTLGFKICRYSKYARSQNMYVFQIARAQNLTECQVYYRQMWDNSKCWGIDNFRVYVLEY